MCDKTDSKLKWVGEPIAWFCCPGRLFWGIFAALRFYSLMLCSDLMMVHAKRMYHTLTQGIRTIKSFTEYKKCYFQ